MKCVICQEKDATPTSDVCFELDCIKKFLQSGRGSASGNPYKTFMRHCAAVLKEQEQNGSGDAE